MTKVKFRRMIFNKSSVLWGMHPLGITIFFTIIWLSCLCTSVHAGKCIPSSVLSNSVRRYVVDAEAQVTMPLTLGTSDRVSHRLTTTIFKIFLQEVVGYQEVQTVKILDTFNPVATINFLNLPMEAFLPAEENRITSDSEVYDYMENSTYDTDRKIELNSSQSSIKRRRHTENTSRSTMTPFMMLNLEVWLPPGFSDLGIDGAQSVIPCGNQGTGGRFGWYVPQSSLHNSHSITDHWRSLQNGNVTQHFRLTPEELSDVKKKFTRKPEGGYFCPEISQNKPLCEEGIYVPPQCRNSMSCATVFAGHFEHSAFLARQVVDQKLKVQIAWIGPNLTPEFVQKFRANKQIIFISWWPSPLTVLDGYMRVAFPSCTELDSSEKDNFLCKYELHTLAKQAWSKLKEFASFAHKAAERFSLDHEDYEELLTEYNRATPLNNSDSLTVVRQEGWDSHIIEEIACNFLTKFAETKTNHLRFWAPDGYNKRTVLWVAGIFPMGITPGRYSSATLIHAAKFAQDDINNNNTVLRDYSIQINFENGQCKSDRVLFSFIKYIRMASNHHSKRMNQLVGILGPGCSDTVEPLAGIAKMMKTTILSYSAEGAISSEQGKYRNFFRTIPENKLYRYVYIQLPRALKWVRMASLTEDGNKYSEYLTLLQDSLQLENITNVTIFNKKFPRGVRKGMSTYLSYLKDQSYRIIIGDFYADLACEVMCEAYRLGMTLKNGYVWFLPSWFHPNWFDVDSMEQKQSCTTKDLLTALDGHLSLGYAYYAPDEAVYHSGRTVGEWKHRYEKQYNTEPADYAGYTYDAVWTYAFALDKLIKEDHTHVANLRSDRTSQRFNDILRQTNFTGISGHIQFGGGPSRKTAIVNIMQFRADPATNNSRYNIVGKFYPDANHEHGGKLDLYEDAINWFTPGNVPPSDGTVFVEENCLLYSFSVMLGIKCELSIVILLLLVFLLFMVVVMTTFLIYKARHSAVQLKNVVSEELQEVELPRENVVINRTIGEGAFGTVFGGECLVPGEPGLKAVAVKTLKITSAESDRVDFLAEAEMMKRFKHDNIVKLIGICIQEKPYYLVMEFMLYGDLKTYLLARRHLVVENSSFFDSDEVSSKRLTSMGLDVAKALDYISKEKYVHRDVACRNCLVNANRVVKLSDFGLTRPVYDTNYYRLVRKGMLPVRWMAPEALKEQRFTIESDMWSYGVLLYEIITFGNFPFLGMSNLEVLDYVQNGNTIKLPVGIKKELSELLHHIWSYEPRQRPRFHDIIQLLSRRRRFIEPCLEDPLASVQVNGQDDVAFSEFNRRTAKPKQHKTSHNSGEQNNCHGENGQLNSCIIDPTHSTIFSSNSVICNGTIAHHLDRKKAALENGKGGAHEPLLPLGNNSYIGRYARLQVGRSIDSGCTDLQSPDTTAV